MIKSVHYYKGLITHAKCLEDLAKVRNPLYEEIADITLPTDEQNAKVMVNQIVDLIDNLNGLNGSL